MKLTKSIEKSENYHKSLCKYLYIIYKDKKKNEILEITIQNNIGDYAVYFDMPIQLNLNLQHKQISLIEMNNYFLTSLTEVDYELKKISEEVKKVIDRRLEWKTSRLTFRKVYFTQPIRY